jgi:steroid delta-isomerase-like uncharacterized protein
MIETSIVSLKKYHQYYKRRNSMSEKNLAVTRRDWEETWNQGNLDLIDEHQAADYVGHFLPPGLPAGREGYRQFVKMYRAAFPDVHIAIDDLIASGDKVVTRFTATGTHQGELMGIPATGKKINITGISIYRFVDGQIVEDWAEFDQLGMLTQLGVIPPAGGTEG